MLVMTISERLIFYQIWLIFKQRQVALYGGEDLGDKIRSFS